MERRTALIITIVAAVLCGCSGLFTLCGGGTGLVVSFIPGADIDLFGITDPDTLMLAGIGAMCGGIILIAIPIVIGILTLRKKSEKLPEPPPGEPIPPTS